MEGRRGQEREGGTQSHRDGWLLVGKQMEWSDVDREKIVKVNHTVIKSISDQSPHKVWLLLSVHVSLRNVNTWHLGVKNISTITSQEN